MVLVIEQRISRRKEINFNFFVLQLWKKSGFYSGILLDFEEKASKKHKIC